MRLPTTAEPNDVKEYFHKEFLRDPWLATTVVKQATWASFLWRELKPYLDAKGATWPLFERAIRKTSHVFVDWANGRTSWQTTLRVLSDEIGDAIAWKSHRRPRIGKRT